MWGASRHTTIRSLRAVFKLLQHLGIFFDTEERAVGDVSAGP